jgi:hypothetical protein
MRADLVEDLEALANQSMPGHSYRAPPVFVHDADTRELLLSAATALRALRDAPVVAWAVVWQAGNKRRVTPFPDEQEAREYFTWREASPCSHPVQLVALGSVATA